jgi:hypothetical protein
MDGNWRGKPAHWALAVALLTVAGCGSIGADSVTRDRTDYNDAVAKSWKEQTLANIVKLRYGDTPVFLDVSSLISQYQLEGVVNAAGTMYTGSPPTSNSVTLGAAGRYIDRPTVTYTPVQGEKFTRSLLRPIPPPALFQLVQAGYPIDLVFQLTVRAINQLHNRSTRAFLRREADPKFYAVLDALRRIQLSESVGFRVEKQGADEAALLVFRRGVSREVEQDIRFVRDALGIDPEASEFNLTFGTVPRNDREVAMLSRSMFEILLELGGGIDVPSRHVEEGRTMANMAPAANPSPRDAPLVRILSGEDRPGGMFTAHHYRGLWYWIDDRDIRSKGIFTFLMLLFSLAETGVTPQAPVVTIPVN